MSYKAIIFDLDNTLIDVPTEFVNGLLKKILSEFNLNHPSEYAGRFWIGPNRDQVIRECFGLEPALFWEVYKKYDTVEARREFIKSYPDVNFLNELKEKGYKLGVVTVTSKEISDFEIGLLKTNFDSVVIARTDCGSEFKPSPRALEQCLTNLDVCNHEALYVGNSDEDLIMSRNARVPSILIVRIDELEQHRHLKEIPSLMIGKLDTLRKILY